MGKGTRKRTATVATAKRTAARPRSFSCTDEDWAAVEHFAARRGLASTSDAARLLLRTGLHAEHLVEEIAKAQEWQLAQAWADAQAIANGDREVGSWDRIDQAAMRARARIRERAAPQRAVMTGAYKRAHGSDIKRRSMSESKHHGLLVKTDRCAATTKARQMSRGGFSTSKPRAAKRSPENAAAICATMRTERSGLRTAMAPTTARPRLAPER